MSKLQGRDFVAFRALSSFVLDIGSLFGKRQRSLALYARLIEKTNVTHEDAITKHISAFRSFSRANRDAVKAKDVSQLSKQPITYSDNVYIDVSNLLSAAKQDPDSISKIWEHLQTISAIVDPEGGAREALEKAQTEPTPGTEGSFLDNVINTIQNNIDPNASDPTQALGQMLSSGALTGIMSDMTTRMEDGSLDMGKMVGAVQGMIGAVGSRDGVPPELAQMTQQLGQMLSSVQPPQAPVAVPQLPTVEETD